MGRANWTGRLLSRAIRSAKCANLFGATANCDSWGAFPRHRGALRHTDERLVRRLSEADRAERRDGRKVLAAVPQALSPPPISLSRPRSRYADFGRLGTVAV
jgi:hypothetical protein